MTHELHILSQYLKAVLRFWWAILTGLVLTILDGVERLLGTWFLPPRWAKVGTAVAGLVVAQFLAYRELVQRGTDGTISAESEFKKQLREAYRRAEVQWNPLRAPGARVRPEVVSQQVDNFAAALAELYSRSPERFDGQPLKEAIAYLTETKKHRFGNLIGSQPELDCVCSYMETALRTIAALVNENPG